MSKTPTQTTQQCKRSQQLKNDFYDKLSLKRGATLNEINAINTGEDSLSDVDVDLDDLESIPEDYVPPMINEDGEAMDITSDADTDPSPSVPRTHEAANA